MKFGRTTKRPRTQTHEEYRKEKILTGAEKKELILLFSALLFVFSVFFCCLYVFANGGPDDKKWAAGIVSAIASGLVGYLVGQGKK